eukprot:scaffold72280_cov44-Prasinocladus_malaysianus.AAC.1
MSLHSQSASLPPIHIARRSNDAAQVPRECATLQSRKSKNDHYLGVVHTLRSEVRAPLAEVLAGIAHEYPVASAAFHHRPVVERIPRDNSPFKRYPAEN